MIEEETWGQWVKRRTYETATDTARRMPGFQSSITDHLKARRKKLDQALDEGKVVVAEISGDPVHQSAQKVLDELVSENCAFINRYFGADRMPEKVRLFVHMKPAGLDSMFDLSKKGMQASMHPDVIEAANEGLSDALKKGSFRLSMAHELAHSVARDSTKAVFPSHKIEIAADFQGGILHGNVQDMVAYRAAQGRSEHFTNPSSARMADANERWCKHLQRLGAVDESGAVVDKTKAIAALERFIKYVDVAQGVRRLDAEPRFLR